MKKILILAITLLFASNVFANEEKLIEQNTINCRINNIGTKILNANKIEKRVVFAYDKSAKIDVLKGTKNLTDRQVIVYENAYKNIENDDELAAYIAREIPAALRSYDGIASGWLSSLKIKAAPKKYELVFDKFAIDYMVKAGYNPLAMIVSLNTIAPQKRYDWCSEHPLTTRRMAEIYEYIYNKYPQYLVQNEYKDNLIYQNFLLTSRENRAKLEQKIKNNSKRKVNYL